MGHHWNIDENLTTDSAGETLLLSAPATGSAHWGEPLDMGNYVELTTHWITDTAISDMNQWGEGISIHLADPETGDVLEFTLHRYCNAVGNYQIHLDSRYENPQTGLSVDGLLEVWSTPVAGTAGSNALGDVRICLTRSSLREALQLRILNGDSSESILSVAVTPAIFRNDENGSRFADNILKSDAIVLGVSALADGSAGWQLTAPVITEPDSTVTQNFFTTDPAWQAQFIDGEITFHAVDGISGQTKYRRPLLTEQPIHYSFQLMDGSESMTMELKNASGAAAFQLTMAQTAALSGTAPDGSPLFAPVSFPADTSACTVDVLVENGTLTLTILSPDGTELCRTPITHEFFQSSSLNLIFTSDGTSVCTLSRFRGLPDVITADRRNLPFTRAVFAGDLVDNWISPLLTDMEEYQCGAIEPVITPMTAEDILSAGGDLIVLAGGLAELDAGVSAESYSTSLRDLIGTLKENAMLGTVILVAGIPAQPDVDVSTYNAVIRAAAQDADILYADLCAALDQVSWSTTGSNIGNLLIAGEVLQTLMRGCTCLAVNSTTDLQVSVMDEANKTKSALNAFCTAEDAESMKKAVENAALGADLELYCSLSNEVQSLVVDALLAFDRSGITDFTEVDALINRITMTVSAENPRRIRTGAPFTTYVAVGDSVSAGEVTVNRSTDGWVPRFASLVSAAQETDVVLINKAISGTRMCTITDNKVFPAAKDTVQEYIVANDPDLLTIAYGFNDLNAGTSLSEFIETYRGYLTEIRQYCPDTVIIICGVYATPGDHNGANIRRWNVALKELAEEFDLIFADTYYDILGSGWLIADGVHPTNAGHRVMANSAFQTLCRHMDLTGNTLPASEDPVDEEPEPATEPEPTEAVEPAPRQKFPAAIPWLGAALLAAASAVFWIAKRRKKK